MDLDQAEDRELSDYEIMLEEADLYWDEIREGWIENGRKEY